MDSPGIDFSLKHHTYYTFSEIRVNLHTFWKFEHFLNIFSKKEAFLITFTCCYTFCVLQPDQKQLNLI